jgi:Leucine-rich repeat (LRR) protein
LLGLSTGSERPETESGKPSAPAANRITYEDLPEHLKCRTEVARSLDLSQPGQSSGGFQVASDVEMSAGVVLDRFGCIPLSVTSLNLDTLHLEDAAVLAFLPALEQLTLSNTAIKDWSFLEVMTSLRKLDLKATGILNLQPLSGLTGLRTLDLFGTPAASWDGLAPLANLHWFRAPDGQAAGNPLIDSASTRAQVAELIASGTFKP